MAKPNFIELGDGTRIPILFEDRSVIAIDKPAGWILAPDAPDNARLNLQRAIESSINAGDFWARSRGLKFLRFVHRLDAETTGVLLCAKSLGAVRTISELFEARTVKKRYLVVVRGVPRQTEWTCLLKLGPVPDRPGYVRVDPREGKEAETHFRVLQAARGIALVEARPVTGRTHQIRVHLLAAGHPVLGDSLYGPEAREYYTRERPSLGLRAIEMTYRDPFQRKEILIRAPIEQFLKQFGFDPATVKSSLGESSARSPHQSREPHHPASGETGTRQKPGRS
ncbi:MAG: RluA family pseudouridine synthase [Verrucomicrobia bacterium]|nr:RluA family pseudouridine synthase [Verrucomicrobiota bacterium]